MSDIPSPAASVAHSWGNALARRWAPVMPRPLAGPFLTAMYALRTLASADGHLRYNRDRRSIPLPEIARACRSNEKDTRLFLTAAIAAGVLAGDRSPGSATLYVLLLNPAPNWAAAVAVIEAGRRRPGREPAPWHEAAGEPTPGHRDPTPHAPTPGHRDPSPEAAPPGHRDPRGVGSPRPEGVGSPRPAHPGDDHVLHQGVGTYETYVETTRARDASHGLAADGDRPPPARPHLAPVPDPPPGATLPRQRARDVVPEGQAPLLLAVPAPPAAAVPPPQRSITGADVARLGWRDAFPLALDQPLEHPDTGT